MGDKDFIGVIVALIGDTVHLMGLLAGFPGGELGLPVVDFTKLCKFLGDGALLAEILLFGEIIVRGDNGLFTFPHFPIGDWGFDPLLLNPDRVLELRTISSGTHSSLEFSDVAVSHDSSFSTLI